MKFLFTLFLFLTSSPLYLFSQQHKLITGEEALAKSTALAQSKQFDSATYYVLIAQEKFKSANRIKDYFRSKIQELQIWIKDGRLEQTFEANHNLLDEIREYYGDSTALEALVYKNFGESYYKKGLLNDATVWWEKSLSLIQNYNEEYYASEIAFLSNNLGISYARRAYYDQAAPHFERALYIYQNYDSKRKARGILRTYNNLGNLNYLLGNIGKAVAMYQKSIELKKKVYKTSQHPSIALSYANMGNMLRAVGRYQEAIEYLNSSIEITKNKQGKDRKALRQSYGVLSEIYRLTKEFDLCKEHIDKEYELRLIDDGPQSLEMANVYVNYGLYFNDIGNYQKAIDYFNKALEIFELKKLPLSEDVGEAHYYIGASYMQLDRREEAMDKFEESRRVFAALDLSKNAMLSVINQGIGKLLSERGEYDLAEKYLWQAINANVKSDWNATDNPLANYHNGSLLLTTIEHLTSLYKEKGLKSDDHTLLTKSLHYIDYGDTLINQLQKTNTNDTDKLLFREKVNKIYETGIWLSYQLYSQSKDAKFVEKAHYFMERNRNSLSLLELNDAQAQLTIGISDSLRETEGELNALISYHKSQIYQLENVDGNIDSVRLDHHRAALFESSQNRRKWIKNIEEDYPDYAQLKYKVDYPTISELQSVLTSDQTLLEYSMGLDAGYGILIGKNNYEFVSDF
ncbi:MAG: tetratricopeptide repeat protein [Bacteroidota bacterium]